MICTSERTPQHWWVAYQVLWPIPFVLLAEVGAMLLWNQFQPSPTHWFTLTIAGIVLLAGLLPGLIRPSAITRLVGCFAVVLSSILWQAPNALTQMPNLDQLAIALGNSSLRLSLFNVVLLAPLTLHLVAMFPKPGVISPKGIASYYAVMLCSTLGMFAVAEAWRQAALFMLVVIAYTGFGIAGYQLLRIIQLAQHSAPRVAQQARFLLLSLAVSQAPFLLLPIHRLFQLFIPYELMIGAQIILPVGMAYAALRHDIFGIDAALRRALDYAIVSFGLLLIYFGLTAFLTQISQALGGMWGFVATITSVVAAAAAFMPLRRLAQHWVDHIFYPERIRFATTLALAHTMLAQVVQHSAVVELFEEQLPAQLGAAWAKLVLRPAFDQPALASQEGTWNTLITVGGQVIGQYWLGPRQSGLRYAPDEQAQLQSVVQQAGLVLAYVETVEQLVQFNNELEERVAIRSEHVLAQQRELVAFEERQRLARDLHDSVKQTLFSIGIGIRTARNRIAQEPAKAIQLLEQQEQIAVQAQAEMGNLLAQLRTPTQATIDLVALLQRHTTWLQQQHGLQVDHEMPTHVVLPEPIAREVAQIAKEALHNVLRHSGTNQAQVSLAVTAGLVSLHISDQGQGFKLLQTPASLGLQSMQERATLLGGTFTIRSACGKGTTIWVQVPIISNPA